jgi:Protein of unknown function TPD sequence-motif
MNAGNGESVGTEVLKVAKSAGRIDISWPVTFISSSVYSKIRNHALRETNYRTLSGKKKTEFHQFVHVLKSTYQTEITAESAESIRNAVLKDKIIRSYSKMNHMIGRISTEYNKSSIVELSSRYDFPPLNLLRGILLFRHFNPSQIYDIFAGRKKPHGILSGRNLEQYELALKNDAEASFNQQEVARVAAENEARTVSYFNSIGIAMKTQDELTKEQMKEYGRAVATPDILFTETVYVNGERVHWLDYKDYTATEIPFIFNSNVDQAARYIEKWGPGIMCYRTGVVENVTIPSTMCLSAEHLPIKF